MCKTVLKKAPAVTLQDANPNAQPVKSTASSSSAPVISIPTPPQPVKEASNIEVTVQQENVVHDRAIEVVSEKLFFCTLNVAPSSQLGISTEDQIVEGKQIDNDDWHSFNVDDLLSYRVVGSKDFGPLNLGAVYRFCLMLHQKLKEKPNAKLLFWTQQKPQNRSNATFLLGCYLILVLQRSPEEVYSMFRECMDPPLVPFCDASLDHQLFLSPALPTARTDARQVPAHNQISCLCSYVTVEEALHAVARAVRDRFFEPHRFDVGEYDYYSKNENGGINVIVPGKLMALIGPRDNPAGSAAHTPADYLDVMRHLGVSDLVRLNENCYDAAPFVANGINHWDLPFPDGNVPPPTVISSFLRICSQSKGMVAVHCKAGLGRTGTCLASYMIYHYGWPADQAIAWIRVARPGSVFGIQKLFLQLMEPLLRQWSLAGDQKQAAIEQQAFHIWRAFQQGHPYRYLLRQMHAQAQATTQGVPPAEEEEDDDEEYQDMAHEYHTATVEATVQKLELALPADKMEVSMEMSAKRPLRSVCCEDPVSVLP
eukprot:TRINITY_DN667_c0_g1_i4.p1 TRINITY_DN667_c0_g1~~TRINITY_DN667_c0_g1_i4.p1  ORF type:complete len:540 (-),score=222.45 TRINITY_DN667_c0_g1_i4:385-2004(-)